MSTCLDSAVSRDNLLGWSYLKVIPEETDATKVNTMADAAIVDAVKDFWSDMSIRLSEYSTNAQPFFKGIISEKSYSVDKTFISDYLGLVIRSKGLKDTKFYLNKIGLLINETKDVTVSLYESPYDEGEIKFVEDFTVSATANSLSWSSALTDKVYDFYKDGCAVWYYLVINPTTEKPKDNKIYCGCSGRRGQEMREIQKYANVFGVQGDDLTKMNDWTTSSSANGILLDVEFKCDVDNLLCLNYQEETNFQRVTNEAIKNKAGVYLIQQILDNPDIERLALVSLEHLYGKRNHMDKEYGDRIEWLASKGVNVNLNDCLTCEGPVRTVPA